MSARIFSPETYARLDRQLAYYFTPEHLTSSAHALELHRRNNGFTFEEIMLWPRVQGFSLLEIADVIMLSDDLRFRPKNAEANFKNADLDEMTDYYELYGMSDDDKKKEYLFKHAEIDDLAKIYGFGYPPLSDFVVFKGNLVYE